MVFVSVDELANGLGVRRLGLVIDEVRAKGLAARGAQTKVKSHGGGLVNNNDAAAVGELHHLLGVGVVGGAEGVCADPV